jgi:hypothetical protein
VGPAELLGQAAPEVLGGDDLDRVTARGRDWCRRRRRTPRKKQQDGDNAQPAHSLSAPSVSERLEHESSLSVIVSVTVSATVAMNGSED